MAALLANPVPQLRAPALARPLGAPAAVSAIRSTSAGSSDSSGSGRRRRLAGAAAGAGTAQRLARSDTFEQYCLDLQHRIIQVRKDASE